MTPERLAVIVVLWAGLYTRRVPEQDAQRRVEELRADLHDHIAHERAQGTGERRIAVSIATRMLRGLAADVSWRHERKLSRDTQEDRMPHASRTRRSAIRGAAVTAVLLLVPLTLTVAAEGADWGVFDFVLAAAIIAGGAPVIAPSSHCTSGDTRCWAERRRRGAAVGWLARARSKRCAHSASSRCSADASASSTLSDTPARLPRSIRV